jgi:GT2 family glycosyltransferase
MTSRPPLSVVVPTRNVAGTIESCLDALVRALPEPERDIVVVDNGSSDDTLVRVRRYPVRVIERRGGFVSASRNAGAQAARHDLVAFIDSDCVVEDGWREALTAALAGPDVGIVGHRHVLRPEATWVERAWDAAHRKPMTDPQADVVYVPAGNFAARRDVFLDVGGFDETLETGEDPDLCARVAQRGLRIVEVRAMRVAHLGEPRTLGAVFRRERWHGRGARLRYGDGRLAPITIATVAFGVLLLVALAAFAGGLVVDPRFAVALALPLAVPAVYAARYARPPRARQGIRLLAIYTAYFLGRTWALPVVAWRAIARRRARTPGGAAR